MGLITPLGIGVENTWAALCAGKSGVTEITRFDSSAHQTRIAAEVKDFKPQDFMPQTQRTFYFVCHGGNPHGHRSLQVKN
jgi:3-oxoacyl-[acyl-carrier-protein] synthase II